MLGVTASELPTFVEGLPVLVVGAAASGLFSDLVGNVFFWIAMIVSLNRFC